MTSPLLEPAEARGWTRHDATHLLWRAQFGATDVEIERALDEGRDATVERLLAGESPSAPFVTMDRALEDLVGVSGSPQDLRAWWIHRMHGSAHPLQEKMTLFWHNHFATSIAKVRSTPHMAAQNRLFRQQALGSFRELLHAVARDVAMLIWLDGNANRRRHPNENFARELMELFSLGVGHYSETDVQEAARAFTGWHVRQDRFWKNPAQHDESTKTVLGRTGNLDGDDVVEICLAQEACPRWIGRKLLMAFVMPEPSEEAVAALAAELRRHDYQLAPVLGRLFRSALFFSPEARQSIIKSPVELVVGAQRTLQVRPHLPATAGVLAELGQNLLEPPTVEGWKGNRLWINSATWLQRINFAAELVYGSRYGVLDDPAQTARQAGWRQPSEALSYYRRLLLARDVPDAEPVLAETFRQASGTVGERLRGMIHAMMCMPEFQLL